MAWSESNVASIVAAGFLADSAAIMYLLLFAGKVRSCPLGRRLFNMHPEVMRAEAEFCANERGL